MPRRTSYRLRGGATPGAAGGSNNPPDGETGGSDDHAVLCPPLPASPGKRKARSPVEEMMDDHGGLSAPSSTVRCSSLAFQSPKKKPSADRGAAAAGVLDRLNAAPLHKESDLAAGCGSSISGAALTAPFAFGHTGHSNSTSGFLHSGAGGGSFRLSAFSAFSSSSSSSSSSTISSRDIVRRRTREECPTPGRGPAPAATAVNHASSPSNHLQFHRAHSGGGDMAKPTPLPFLLPPANITSSPDLGNKTGSRRARRTCRITRSRDSGTSSNNGSPSPALTPAARSMPWRGTARTAATGRAETADFTPIASRGRSLSGTGCAAAGGRRAATSATTASPACAASPPPGEKSSGGGPAGACRSGGGGCDSETDQSPTCRSPIRSPVHRLTESLQKWAPGSRYKSIRDDADAVSTAVEAPVATKSGQKDRRRHNDSARSCVAGAASTSASSKIAIATTAALTGGTGRDVCAGVVASSWSGQELRRTLEQESVSSAVAGDVCQGHRRARSHTEEVMFPHDRFQDSPAYSPISPASSVGSINLAGAEDRAGDGIRGFAFGASSGEGGGATPASAGRPWRSSPSRASRSGGGMRHTADSGRSRVGAGTAERFAMVRMQGSWSDDEDVSGDGGSSATVMRLAFSPGGGGGREAEAPSTAAVPGTRTQSGAGGSGAGVEAVAPAVAATALPPPAWESPLSPMKGKRPGVPSVFARGAGAGAAARVAKGTASELARSPGSSLGSPMPSRIARRGLLRSESPEDHSLQSVRDLMDEGTDEEDEGGDGHGGGGRLFRRRRRRQLPGLGLRALEMPDASADLTVVDGEGEEGRTGEGTSTSCGGSMMMMTMDDDEVTITTTDNAAAATTSPPCQNTPNPLSSPAAPDGGACDSSKWSLSNTGGGIGGALDNSSCPTTCGRWEYQDASGDGGGAPGPLESTRIDADEGPSTLEETWTRNREDKGKNSATDGGEGKRVWAPSTEGFGTSSSPEGGRDVTQVSDSSNTSTNSAAALGIDGVSGLSGADTSGASDTSTSFKSRPIPDQSAFSSTRISRGGAGAPLSPQAGGGPAIGPGPLCVTPRKSVMRCPPTPQRTPTWDGLEDSLLLEGAGSGGRSGRVGLGGAGDGVCGSGGESGGSVRRSLRSHSKLRGSSGSGDKHIGRGGGAGFGDGIVIDTGLANTSEFCSLLAEAADEKHPGAGRVFTRSGGGLVAEVNEGSGTSSRNHGSARTVGQGSSRARGGRRRVIAAAAARSGGDDNGSGSGGGIGNGGGTGIAAGSTESTSKRGGLSTRRAGETAASGARGEDKLGFKNDFVQMGPIGEGGFSVVWKVRAKGTGRLYAIKRSKREFRGKRDRDRCLLEARALHRLGEHPGVLRFERAWQEEGHFCLQTELCELGTLKDFLERLPTRWEIPEPAVWQVLHDVGQALRHVHATQLVHLDVKPANLLIGDEGGRLKLADFGMATGYGEGAEGSGDCQEGDTLYMAKELLSSTERLPSADMFSLGLTVYEVATRTELPGDGEDWHAMRDGRALGLPGSRSQALGDLVRQLMHPNPERRPTADGLCKHPKIAEISGSSFQRNDFVVSQARAWRAAEAAVMKHPSNGLRTPTGDMSARYIFQQTG